MALTYSQLDALTATDTFLARVRTAVATHAHYWETNQAATPATLNWRQQVFAQGKSAQIAADLARELVQDSKFTGSSTGDGSDVADADVQTAVDTLLHVPASLTTTEQRNLEADAGDDLTMAVQMRPVPSGGIADWTLACEVLDFAGNVLASLSTASAQEVQIVDAAGGNCNVYLAAALTGTTLGAGTWNYRVRRTDTSQVTTLVRGRLKLR